MRAFGKILPLALLVFLPVLIYSNTFSVPFQFDDHQNIVENAQITNLADFSDLSGTRYVGFLSFALNYALNGLNVFGYHLVNLLIHIANGFLVYWLVLLLLSADRGSRIEDRGSTFDLRSSSRIALATTLLFLVHPIQTQAVTYIVQRFASLVTLFYLLAVVCYFKWRLAKDVIPAKAGIQKLDPRLRGGDRKWLWYLASLLSCILAMKTKENSFTLPVMILLVELVFFKPLQWKAVIPFFLLAAPIIPLSHNDALGEAEGFARDTADIGRLDYLFTQFRVIVTYLRLLVFPVNQTLDYDYPVYHSFFQPAVFLSFLFLAGLLAFAIGLIGRISPIRLISFGLLWFFLTLSVESSIFPIKDVIFEHRVYLSSVGFFLGISCLAEWLWQRCQKKKVLSVLFVLSVLGALGSLATATYNRNLVWKDPLTLWQDVTNKAPNKARGHYGVGKAYQVRGNPDKAIREYEETLSLKQDYFDAWLNLGVSLKNQGRIAEAVRAYQAALRIRPDSVAAHHNLGNAYKNLGRISEAVAEFERVLQISPDFAPARRALETLKENKKK